MWRFIHYAGAAISIAIVFVVVATPPAERAELIKASAIFIGTFLALAVVSVVSNPSKGNRR